MNNYWGYPTAPTPLYTGLQSDCFLDHYHYIQLRTSTYIH